MKTKLTLLVSIIYILVSVSFCEASREYIDFDFDWKFSLGDNPIAYHPDFDDSSWRTLNVPHDWSIEGPFDQKYASGTGYAPGGVGWYRKSFYLREANKDKQVFIEFDGVYCNSEVYVNGQLVGKRPNGYSSFRYDITPYLPEHGTVSTIAVRVDHSKFADSRWYTGSGIYRHVRLCITDKLNIDKWGTYITTPKIENTQTIVKVETKIQNKYSTPKSFILKYDIISPDGKIAATITTEHTAPKNQSITIDSEIALTDYKLWSIDNPHLYTIRSTLISDSIEIDKYTSTFGIRSFEFDSDKGFSLNGKSIKLKGLCIHHDAGSLGSAVPDKILRQRLKLLKSIGCNAIRTAHNPPSPELLDMCDQLGLLVQDEAFDEFTPAKNKWIQGRNNGLPSRYGYAENFDQWAVTDIQDMVLRDRNHPSIIMWSIGNEIDYPNDPFSDPSLEDSYIPNQPSAKKLTVIGKKLVTAIKNLDTTRPTTVAIASAKMSNATEFADVVDITGYNYQEQYYAADHKEHPNRVIYGSETGHGYSQWLAVKENDYISGQFLWTAFDYLGEAPAWPTRIFSSGLFDTATFKKPLGYWRQALWSDEPMVYFVTSPNNDSDSPAAFRARQASNEHWNYNRGSKVNLNACTNCQEVVFMLNGNEIRAIDSTQAKQGWLTSTVTYEPGTIVAIGRNNGKEVCRYTLTTSEKPASVKLAPGCTELKADGKDTCQIIFRITDEKGTRVYDAENEVTFTITGPARIIGIDNAKLDDTSSYKDNTHNAYKGKGLLTIQSEREPGKITIKAESPDLTPAEITIEVKE